ncbi:hypothetical protein Hanom_Chr04g00311081 [Helianthus anomalus]
MQIDGRCTLRFQPTYYEQLQGWYILINKQNSKLYKFTISAKSPHIINQNLSLYKYLYYRTQKPPPYTRFLKFNLMKVIVKPITITRLC